jgi:hypothetical protein
LGDGTVMKEDWHILDEEQIETWSEKDEGKLVSTIHSQFDELQELGVLVNEAIQKAEEAQKSADLAKEKAAGVFRKKGAIESLQTAAADLAEAQVTAAEAQKLTFRYQERVGEITRYLFCLGINNIALNRTIVREIEMRLRDASREELSDLARQELINTIEQLKAQEDIMKKQSDLARRIFDDEQQIGLLQERIDQQRQITVQLQEENSTLREELQNKADLRLVSAALAVSALSLILWGLHLIFH